MEILLKNGWIIDGTGSSRYKSDIAIKDNKILKIGSNLEGDGYDIIDVSNKIIAPGFIDMHSHADLTILEVNKAEAAIMQGVTTLVVGMCGIGRAPANEKVRKYYSNFITKAFGSSVSQLYDSLQDYMEALKKKGVSTNLVFFIPHGNVRVCILGLEDRSATSEELEEMKEIVKKEMEIGAFGLSTGLVYPPGSITPTYEIIELCKVVNNYGGLYDTHMRNEGTRIMEQGIREVIEIAKNSNVRAHISHLKTVSKFAWKSTHDIINLIKNVKEEQGIFLHADLYPYEESSTSLSGILLNPWVYDDFEQNLTNSEARKKIVTEILDMIFSTFLSDLPFIIRIIPKFLMKKLIFSSFKKDIRIISVLKNHHIEGKFLGEALKILYPKRSFYDAVLDFIRDEEGSIVISIRQMSEKKSILSLFKQDFVCVGSDGFLVIEGNTHPRSYGTFPRILSRYVREKQIVSLEEAIRKMTSLPASILRLRDRGIIKQNYKADLVIFDPQTIRDNSTYENGRQYPEGIDYVIVNGKITVAKGEHLGVLNGQILKHEKMKKSNNHN